MNPKPAAPKMPHPSTIEIEWNAEAPLVDSFSFWKNVCLRTGGAYPPHHHERYLLPIKLNLSYSMEIN
jgi:hypothetical protein